MDAPRRTLGKTGLEVHPLCLGGNVFGWTADAAASEAVLDAYVAAGGNFLDTADTYSGWAEGNSGGESETVIGDWMRRRGNRDRLVLATKVGSSTSGSGRPGGLSEGSIREGVEGSLRRLGVERIDLYYAHYDDPDTPLSDTLEAFDRLMREGLVTAIGASNHSSARLAEALAVSDARGLERYRVFQPHYSLVERTGFEEETLALCEREGIAVCPYWALARGFLTGKYRPNRPLPQSARAAGLTDLLASPRGLRILDALDEIAAAHDGTPAQVTLAWTMSRSTVVAPIASATRPEQLTELMGAAALVLSGEETAALDAASAP